MSTAFVSRCLICSCAAPCCARIADLIELGGRLGFLNCALDLGLLCIGAFGQHAADGLVEFLRGGPSMIKRIAHGRLCLLHHLLTHTVLLSNRTALSFELWWIGS